MLSNADAMSLESVSWDPRRELNRLILKPDESQRAHVQACAAESERGMGESYGTTR